MKTQTLAKYGDFRDIVARLATLGTLARPEALEAAERGVEALDTALICVGEAKAQFRTAARLAR